MGINKKHIKSKLVEALDKHVNKKLVAGVLIKCSKTGRVFLLYRNDKSPIWALVSGGVDKGESPLDCLKREVREELFIHHNQITFKYMGIETFPDKNMEFYYFQGFCEEEFEPILDHENLKWGWFDKDKLPSPLYKGLADKIANI